MPSLKWNLVSAAKPEPVIHGAVSVDGLNKSNFDLRPWRWNSSTARPQMTARYLPTVTVLLQLIPEKSQEQAQQS